MKYLSLCSGIEAATVAWHPLGWEAVAYSEIERFPSEVLAHHYPSTPNLGDMTKFKEWNLGTNVDLLVGGTPCQSFSVAGLRKGLDDPRGNLMLTYLAIADKYRPRWLVWENVPGVLSSNGGKDFGVFLGALGELGYGFAYRILDAQYFGVAQRRRRVFVVGYLGDWRAAAAVLFERHSLQGHPAPSREARKSVASYTPSSIGGYSEGVGTLRAHGGDIGGGSENLIASKQWPADISSTLDTTFGTKQGLEDQHVNAGCPMFVPSTVQTLRTRRPGEGGMSDDHQHLIPVVSPALNTCSGANHAPDTKAYLVQPIAFSGQMSNPQTDVDMTQTLQAKNPMAVAVGTDLYNGAITGDVAVPMTNRADGTGTGPTVMQAKNPMAFAQNTRDELRYINGDGSLVGALAAQPGMKQTSYIQQAMAVRRLTPVECERLQGFGDNYTDIKSKNKPTPDGPRYKALGNSMAVPVMAWIGQRIQEVEAICKQNK